jgi:anaerobic magnesium-protoporphyrin IX monomethyl ester cyclase
MEDKKKVLLINPGPKIMGDINMPIHLVALANPLLKNNYDPVLIDTRVDDYKDLDFNQFVCVAISAIAGPILQVALDITDHIRKVNPNLPLIWGGPHPTLDPDSTIKDRRVDVAVLGDAEETFLKIVQAIDNGRSIEDLGDIDNILFKKDGKIVRTPIVAEDFNKFNPLPYHLLDIRKYPNTLDKFEYSSSRGCPYRCTFCSSVTNSNRTWRPKSADLVLKELEIIMEKYNPRRFTFVDALFYINKKRVEEICKGIIERGWKLKIYTLCRADVFSRFDSDFLNLIRKAGINEVGFGGETGSQRVMDFIKKDMKVEKLLEAAKLCGDHNITPIYSFMVGVPTETERELKETLNIYDKLLEVNPKTQSNAIYIFTPIASTPINQYIIDNYNYKSPKTLEEWVDWKWSAKKNIPWMSAKKLRRLEGITMLARYKFVRQLMGTWSFKEKLVRHGNYPVLFASILFNSLFYIPMKLRWKYRFFKFPVEFVLWEKSLHKFKGNA